MKGGTALPSVRERMESLVGSVQEEICVALEGLDGGRFRQEPWKRSGGGGGVTRLLAGGGVIEKAGVNASAVWGRLDESAARAMRASRPLPAGNLEFYACGVSVVVPPANPHAPTAHCNVRYLEMVGDGASAWWFGGGADLTPALLHEDDAAHFHRTLKAACDRHDPAFYARFKRWCDDYFFLPHRGEARGVGGIFFDDLADRDRAALLAFVADAAHTFVPAYLPIVERRKDEPFSPSQRELQLLRRGRYVEFNLLYDRGTAFGLHTGGRAESVLMSLPPLARWGAGPAEEPGPETARLLEVLRHPREWA
jgi:coproporphyrinogen III oxidase